MSAEPTRDAPGPRRPRPRRPVPTPRDVRASAVSPRRRATPLLVVAAIASAVVATATVAYATVHTNTVDRRTAPASAPIRQSPSPDSAALAWMRTNVARSDDVAASGSVAAALRRAGFVRVSARVHDATAWVVRDAGSPAGATADQQTVPVAVFGSVRVESVVRGSATHVRQLLDEERSERRRAGADLAVNPRIRANAPDRAALRAGALDQRAAAVLAVLAGGTTVRIAGLPQDASERRAGRARRVLTLTIDGRILDGVLASLPSKYAPRTVHRSAGAATLVWSAAIADELRAG